RLMKRGSGITPHASIRNPTAGGLQRLKAAKTRHPNGQRGAFLLKRQFQLGYKFVAFRFNRTRRLFNDNKIVVQASPTIFAGFHVASQIIRKESRVYLIVAGTFSSRRKTHLPMLAVARAYF